MQKARPIALSKTADNTEILFWRTIQRHYPTYGKIWSSFIGKRDIKGRLFPYEIEYPKNPSGASDRLYRHWIDATHIHWTVFYHFAGSVNCIRGMGKYQVTFGLSGEAEHDRRQALFDFWEEAYKWGDHMFGALESMKKWTGDILKYRALMVPRASVLDFETFLKSQHGDVYKRWERVFARVREMRHYFQHQGPWPIYNYYNTFFIPSYFEIPENEAGNRKKKLSTSTLLDLMTTDRTKRVEMKKELYGNFIEAISLCELIDRQICTELKRLRKKGYIKVKYP